MLSMPTPAAHRLHRGTSCGRFCCRCSTPCVRSGCWSSRSTTTCCSAGLWALAWTTPYGTMRCSRRTRDRLLTPDGAQRFIAEVNKHAKRIMSDDHFTVDGTLIQAWASQRTFRSKDGSDDGDGTTSTVRSAPIRRMSRPPTPMRGCTRRVTARNRSLSYLGHALVENRNGLIAAAMVTHADGYAERDAALLMLAEKQEGRSRRITVGCRQGLRHEGFRQHGEGS